MSMMAPTPEQMETFRRRQEQALTNPQTQVLPGEGLNQRYPFLGGLPTGGPPTGGQRPIFPTPPPVASGPNAGLRADGRSANDLARQLARVSLPQEQAAAVQSEIKRLNAEAGRTSPQSPIDTALPGALGNQPLAPRPVFERDAKDLSGDEVYRPLFSPQAVPNGPFGGAIGGIGSLFGGRQAPDAENMMRKNQMAFQAQQLMPQSFQPLPVSSPQMTGGYGLSNYSGENFSKGVMALPQIQENFYSPPAGGYTAPAITSPYQMV